MPDEKPKDATPKKVSMKALQYHTYDNKAYNAGDTYDADEAMVETLEAMKYSQRAELAAAAEKPPLATGKAPAAATTTPKT